MVEEQQKGIMASRKGKGNMTNLKKFIAIIGQSNSGKSTIIRSLAGCKNKGCRDFVHDKLTQNCVYIIASSLQEDRKSINWLRDILRQVLENDRCTGIVIAIQPSNPQKKNRDVARDVSIEGIFRAVQEFQRFEIFAFILDPTWQAQNGNVERVRPRLAAFGIEPRQLDARRFSHFNATIIQNESGILI